MVNSVLSPLQLTAGSSLLQNQGLVVNAELTTSIDQYESLPLISPFIETIQTGNSVLSSSTITLLNSLAANTCPALADNVPSGYALTVSSAEPGLTGLISTTANIYLGNGDISKFSQALSIAEGYCAQTNQFINSAVNSETYLQASFTNTNNSITGGITSINLATTAFGQDLENLGLLIDLNNLENLGSPYALVQQIIKVAGSIPLFTLSFLEYGVSEEIVVNLNNPTLSITDSVQKAMYLAMTNITGDRLEQILELLNVTTVGITTMSDLLNPVKLFPNSFQSLTTITSNGQRAIYINGQGQVNSSLANELPNYVLSSVV